jgi:hypothetical protein
MKLRSYNLDVTLIFSIPKLGRNTLTLSTTLKLIIIKPKPHYILKNATETNYMKVPLCFNQIIVKRQIRVVRHTMIYTVLYLSHSFILYSKAPTHNIFHGLLGEFNKNEFSWIIYAHVN